MKQVLCSKCKQRPAMFFMTKVEGEKTTQEGLCLKCAMDLNIGPIRQIIQSMGISEDEFDEVSEQFNEMFENGSFEPGGAGTMPFMQNLSAMMGDKENSEIEKTQSDSETEKKKMFGKKGKKEAAKKRKYLTQFCTDLTEKARNGQIDRIIGRENEIYRSIQILCRRTKNNPC
ncbi:MAG: ATP-dependent Clp protease ATP-binding subunit, partial [Clostridia bacterium]|nr:ATP-dependent Clp protease ATP-binding subunit [Clostridia bacterium]